MKSLKENAILLTAANTLQVAVSLVISIGLARLFVDKEVFGKYQQLFIIINFSLSLTSGLPIGLSYFYGQYLKFKDRVGTYKRFFTTLFLLVISIFFLCYWLKGYLADRFENSFFEDYFILFSGLLVFRLLNSIFVNFNLITSNIRFHFFVIAGTVFASLSLIFFAFLFHLNVPQVLLGLLIIEILKWAIFSKNIWKYFKISGRILLTKNELKYVTPMTGVNLIIAITIYTDKLMISYMLDPQSYAEYQVGAFVIPFIGIITGSLVTVLIPMLSNYYALGKKIQIISTLKETTNKATILLLPILIYCIIVGPSLIVALYGQQYQFSGEIFQLYTTKYLLSVVAFSAVMGAIGLQNWIMINAVINFVSNIVLNFFFINLYGIIGAVYATIISTYIGYVFPIYLMKRHLSAKFTDYFPVKMYLKIALVSIVISMGIRCFIGFFDFNSLYSIIFSFPYYLLILYIVGVFWDEQFNLRSLVIKFKNKIHE